MEITLESLGITQVELQSRVVDKLASDMLTTHYMDYGEDGEDDPGTKPTKLRQLLDKKIQNCIDAKVAALAKSHVLPNVEHQVETLCLQETNHWGEAKGKPVSFIEYLVMRAEAYLREEVDSSGKNQQECRRHHNSFSASGTRVTYLVHQHLDFRIKEAMKIALANANSAIVGGIEEAVKIQLASVARMLKVEVKTGR